MMREFTSSLIIPSKKVVTSFPGSMKNSKLSPTESLRLLSLGNRKACHFTGKGLYRAFRAFFMGVGLTGFIIGSPGVALAANLPSGSEVLHGDVMLQQKSSDILQMIQSSQSAIVNWESFDIGNGALVDIVQPNIDAAMLSRVVGDNLSEIDGSLNANIFPA